ncbi:MAG: ATP-grasp domain-containing protein [Pyrinomonadaceae bacterium]|nr:ATP-grasp domain-containing protein [Pyrinomonadaceae bacterium]
MSDSETRPLNVVCLATYFKGVDFIRECKSRGCQVVLITKEKTLGEDWPRESLDDLVALPNDAGPDLFIHLVSLLARQTKIDRIVALEEFDVITAAQIREHFCLSGMSSATARLFRDKLAMSAKVKEAGINLPDFVPLVNHDEVRDFVDRIPPPWVIKPRSDVSAIGIKKGQEPGDVWRAIDELDRRERLREHSPHYLLSRFIPGDVFHVDSLVSNARVIFAGANKYGRSPMDVAHKGGAYISHTILRGADDEKKLFEINRKLLKALGLETGAAHAEFIRSTADGEFYFLEVAARVGGAYIADVLEAASGVNLWREWARLELADKPAAAKLLPARKEYAGIVLSLAKQEYPDTSSYDDPEVVCRVKKKHHAGLIVRSKKLERVQELLTQYTTRFAEDFEAVLPPLERAE